MPISFIAPNLAYASRALHESVLVIGKVYDEKKVAEMNPPLDYTVL